MNTDLQIAPLLELLLKSAGLTLLGIALLAALRRSSAANRHAVSVAIFAALLLLPVTKLMPSRWSFTLEKNMGPAAKLRLPLIGTIPAPQEHANPLPAETIVPRALVFPWKAFALSVWGIGAALLLGRRLLIAFRLGEVVRRSKTIEDQRLGNIIAALVKRCGARAEVRESALCRVPIVVGMVRPIVLLPVEAKDWSDTLISSALQHELGHIRRRDCLSRLLADVVRAIYWLNPLVWVAARQMRLAQEQACDDLVLNSGAPAEEYAHQLVEVVRSLSSDGFTARHALAMAQPSTLETRVLAIVDATRDRSPRSVRGAFAAIVFLVTALALCTSAQLRGAQEMKPAPAEKVVAPSAAEVLIEARFIEVCGKVQGLPEPFQQAVGLKKPGVAAIVTESVARETLNALGRLAGVDVLSAPRLTTRSNQRATIEIVREFKYPTEWDKDAKAGGWKPKTFDTKNLGVTFEVTPQVNSDGTITLHLIPQTVEFAGFRDLDEAKDKLVGQPDSSKPFSERLAPPANASLIPEGHRAQAVFNIRKMNTSVTAKAGESIVLCTAERENAEEVSSIVLVTATFPKQGRFEVQAGSITVDKERGIVNASGNVEIKTTEAVIRADAAQLTLKKAGDGKQD